MSIFSFTLPGGIRCVHQRVRSKVSFCGMFIGTGSRDEMPSEHGMAHLVEHMLFKGTKKRRAYHINNRLENLGGELNAYTTKEETVVHATTLNGDFAKAVELIADIVFNSVFPSGEFEREKEVVIDEINSYKDSPGERIFDDYEDLLFMGSPLGHDILGGKRSLSKYTPDSARDFVSRTYNTDRMVFSSVGNFSDEKFRDICLRHLADIPANPRRFVRTPPPDAPVFSRTVNKNTFQAHCITGARAYGCRDVMRVPFSLLMNMLGGVSSNSILNTAIREKNGLAYNVEAAYTPLSDTGMATIYVGTDRENLSRCLELINAELKKLAEGSISDRRLSIARKQFTGQLYISSEMGEGLMMNAGRSMLLFDGVESVGTIASRIASVTKDEIVAAAGEIFGGGLSTLIYK